MLTSISPSRVVTSASTPGRSRTGTRTSAVTRSPGAPAGRLTRASRARSSTSSISSRSPVADQLAHLAEGGEQPVEDVDDPGAVLHADVRPDGRDDRRRCGSCPGSRRRPGAAGWRARGRCRPPGSSGWPRSGAARGRPWPPGRRGEPAGSSTTLAPRAVTTVADGAKATRVGVGGRGEDPGGPLEQLGVGSVDALLLGAGHGVAPDEARMVEPGDDGPLDAGHVGDDAAARGPRPRPRRRPRPGWRRR